MIFYFNVFRNCHSVLHSSCTILHSYQQCARVPPPPRANQGLLFYVFFCFLNSKYPDGCEVVSHGFDLHFPNDDWIWASFLMLVSHLYLFRKLPIWILCPILNRALWVLSHRNSICHTLNISPLLDTWWRRQWHPTPVLLPENPMDGGAWWAAVSGVTQSWTRLKRLSSSSSRGFPGGTAVKNLPANAGDVVWSLGWDNPLE